MTSQILKKMGININTVPVLDLKRSKHSKIIADRSFSSNSKDVSKIGDYCISEFSKRNIATVIKHIPGHGLAKVDSHKKTPIVREKKEKLLKNDFAAFKNKKSYFAMTAHIIYKDIDNLNTATHSKEIIKLIRKKIGFKNIIISDDISMKSLKFSIQLNTIKAFNAGCNLVLHCNANIKEMRKLANIVPTINKFTQKKTKQFYNFLM